MVILVSAERTVRSVLSVSLLPWFIHNRVKWTKKKRFFWRKSAYNQIACGNGSQASWDEKLDDYHHEHDLELVLHKFINFQ